MRGRQADGSDVPSCSGGRSAPTSAGDRAQARREARCPCIALPAVSTIPLLSVGRTGYGAGPAGKRARTRIVIREAVTGQPRLNGQITITVNQRLPPTITDILADQDLTTVPTHDTRARVGEKLLSLTLPSAWIDNEDIPGLGKARTDMATAAATAYDLRGDLIEACSCMGPCPCWVGDPPDGGHCNSFTGYHIREGHARGVDLSGLSLVSLVQIPGNVAAGNWSEVPCVDANPTDEQHDALVDAFQGRLGDRSPTSPR